MYLLFLQQQNEWLTPQGAIGFALMAIASLLAFFIQTVSRNVWGDVQPADAPQSSAYDIGARALALAESADERAKRAEAEIAQLNREYEAKLEELEAAHNKERQDWHTEKNQLQSLISKLQNEVDRLRLDLMNRERELEEYKKQKDATE